MIQIKNLLNKIKWDLNEDSKNYSLAYLDRIENRLIELKLKDVKIEGGYLIFKEAEIPLHRVKIVKKKGKVIWQRAF